MNFPANNSPQRVGEGVFCYICSTMTTRIVPVAGKSAQIIDAVMTSPDIPDDESLRYRIMLCTEEIVVNIVNYAYNNGNGFIEVSTHVDDEGILTISFKDAGVRFNPLDVEDPDITLGVEERPVGGLGIFMCKKLMDSVNYEYSHGCNHFSMTINIKKDGSNDKQ